MSVKKILLSIIASLSLVIVPAVAVHAANPLQKACDNRNYTDVQRGQINRESAACNVGTGNPISGGENGLLFRIARMISIVAGAIAVIFIIIGGISMMTSGGDTQKFSRGRNTLIFAAVGLVIIAMAQAIITFVVNKVF